MFSFEPAYFGSVGRCIPMPHWANSPVSPLPQGPDLVWPLAGGGQELQVHEPILADLAILYPCGFEALLRLLYDVDFWQGGPHWRKLGRFGS